MTVTKRRWTVCLKCRWKKPDIKNLSYYCSCIASEYYLKKCPDSEHYCNHKAEIRRS